MPRSLRVSFTLRLGTTGSEKEQGCIENHDLLEHISYNLSLYNEDVIVHKLSHQHLNTRFWIVNVSKLNAINTIEINKIRDYAVPVLIGNFIEKFNF